MADRQDLVARDPASRHSRPALDRPGACPYNSRLPVAATSAERRNPMPSSRTLARCLAVLPLVLVLFLSGATRVARAADTATVTVDLNLRTGPSTDFDILRIMPTGSVVPLTGDEVDDFVGVSFDDVQGWAYSGALDFGSAEPVPSASPEP